MHVHLTLLTSYAQPSPSTSSPLYLLPLTHVHPISLSSASSPIIRMHLYCTKIHQFLNQCVPCFPSSATTTHLPSPVFSLLYIHANLFSHAIQNHIFFAASLNTLFPHARVLHIPHFPLGSLSYSTLLWLKFQVRSENAVNSHEISLMQRQSGGKWRYKSF